MYRANRLVTSRLGNVESAYFACFEYGMCAPKFHRAELVWRMFTNAGMYARDGSAASEQKVLDWWRQETRQLLQDSVQTAAFIFLGYDLPVWSAAGLSGAYYNWGRLTCNLVTKHSEGMKLLFLGQATESVKAAHAKWRDLHVRKVSNFTMCYVHMPQTTVGFPLPDASSAETAARVLDEVDRTCPDFDTAILSCGAYSQPLARGLRDRYKGTKNVLSMASAIYDCFGIVTRSTQYGDDKWVGRGMRPEFLTTAQEKYDPALMKDIDNGKYWAPPPVESAPG